MFMLLLIRVAPYYRACAIVIENSFTSIPMLAKVLFHPIAGRLPDWAFRNQVNDCEMKVGFCFGVFTGTGHIFGRVYFRWLCFLDN